MGGLWATAALRLNNNCKLHNAAVDCLRTVYLTQQCVYGVHPVIIFSNPHKPFSSLRLCASARSVELADVAKGRRGT